MSVNCTWASVMVSIQIIVFSNFIKQESASMYMLHVIFKMLTCIVKNATPVAEVS
jgi:hypothetical protein